MGMNKYYLIRFATYCLHVTNRIRKQFKSGRFYHTFRIELWSTPVNSIFPPSKFDSASLEIKILNHFFF